MRPITSVARGCHYGPFMTSRPGSRPHAEPAGSLPVAGAEPPVRFEAELEDEYVRARLLNNRTLIRMACLLGLLVVCLRIAELVMTGDRSLVQFHPAVIIFPLIVLSASALLAWFAWRPS